MSLTNVLQNRREFLKLSALGAGGVLVLSGMLQSCTLKDHDIPNPQGPVIIPSLGDYEIDWNDAAKEAVTTGISMLIPEGGEILSALVNIFWPSNPQESVWDQVKAQVEALIDQKIAADKYQVVSEDLSGLEGLMTKYLNELKNGTNDEKLQRWGDLDSAFTTALPHFQAAGYEVPLLGLFGQFANMYLSVQRDVVISGKEWGRTDADHQQDIADLKKSIQDFTNYTTNTYQAGRADWVGKTKIDTKNAEPFRSVNAYDRQMTLLVLDFRDTWSYYDVTQYPSGANVMLTREIFTDPMGQGVNPDIPFKVASPSPTKLPTQIDAWSGKYYNAIQLTYPQGSGPNGVTQTPRYGSQEPATTHRTLNLQTGNPIVKVDVTFENFVNTIQFTYADGSQSDQLGANRGRYFNFWAPTSSALSSVMIQESANLNQDYAAAVVVFGFQYWQSPSTTLRAIGNLYVKSPKERSEAEFHKAFPKLGIAAGSITQELKAARQAYWASIKKRAE